MTLAEMREMVRASIFDSQKTFLIEDAEGKSVVLDGYINMAQHHVANMLTAQRASSLLTITNVTVTNATPDHKRTVILDGSPGDPNEAVDPRVRTLVGAERYEQNSTYTDDDPSLKVIEFMDAYSERGATGADSLLDKPPIFLYNQTVGFVQPKNDIIIRLYYVRGLDDLSQSDEECQLPIEYQSLVVAYAVIMAIAAQNRSSPEQWWGIYQSLLDGMGLEIQRRLSTPGSL